MAKGKSQETEVQRVVLRPLASIKPNPKNPRTSDPEGLENLCESIKANPAFFNARPILLSDRTGELVIIGGERRSEAAKRLGMTEVPTILLSGLNEAQEDEIMVRDNTHQGEWDKKKLDEWTRRLLKEWGVGKEEFSKAKVEFRTSEFESKFNAIKNEDADYPIIPVCDEDAELFVILSRSETDSNWFREKMKINKAKSYKTSSVYKVNVISMEDVMKCL